MALTQTFIATEDLGSNIVTVAKLALALDLKDASRTVLVKDLELASVGEQVVNKNALEAVKTAANAALAAEVTRATGAEAALQTAITAEESARIAAVSAEATARGAADATLQSNITAEESARIAAVSAEATARSAADTAEASARAAADATLQSNITAEESARIAAVSAEASARAAADATLTTNLSNEVTRATAAEAALQTAITAEESARISAVSAEAAARIAADATLQSNINAEAATRASADTTLTNALAAEVTRAEGQEAAIRSEFATADTNLDTALRAYVNTQVSAEAAARTAADATLTTNLANEVSRATAAEAALQANIEAGLEGLDVKESVSVKATMPAEFIAASLTGLSLDGKSYVEGQRILVMSPAAVSGIWDAHAGAWTRSLDANSIPVELNVGAFTFVESDATGWVLNGQGEWAQFSGSGTYSVGNGLNLVGTQFSVKADMAEFMFDAGTKALLINALNGSKLINSSVQINKLGPDVLRRLGQFDAEICEKVSGAPKRDFPLPGTVFADMGQGSVVVFVNGIKRRNASQFADGDYSLINDAGAAKVSFGYDIPVGAEFSVLFAKSSM